MPASGSMPTNLDDLPAILTVEEAGKVLRLGRSQAYEWVRRGIIPHLRLGRSIKIPKAALQAWLQSCQRSA